MCSASSGSLSYRREASQFEALNPFLDQESFSLWDLSVVWEDDSGHWRGGIHGKNLTDEEYKVAGYFFPTLGLESTITAFYGNPRTVGDGGIPLLKGASSVRVEARPARDATVANLGIARNGR